MTFAIVPLQPLRSGIPTGIGNTMVTHPGKPVPGVKRGRPTLLPPTVAHETGILAGAGFTVLEISEHFGVDRSTMYRQRKYASEFMQSLKEGLSNGVED